jgi:hypothetical protein
VEAPITPTTLGQKCTVLVQHLRDRRNNNLVEITDQHITVVFPVSLIVLCNARVGTVQKNARLQQIVPVDWGFVWAEMGVIAARRMKNGTSKRRIVPPSTSYIQRHWLITNCSGDFTNEEFWGGVWYSELLLNLKPRNKPKTSSSSRRCGKVEN